MQPVPLLLPKEKFNIVNNPTALLKIFDLAGERLEEMGLQEGNALNCCL